MAIAVYVVPLQDLIVSDEDGVESALSSFKRDILSSMQHFECKLNPYHTDYLQNRALENEEKHTSRTYLLLNAEFLDKLAQQGINEDELERLIVAYFTIGVSSIDFGKSGLSNTKKKRYLFGSYRNSDTIGCYVIGELSRSQEYLSEDLPGEVILNLCLESIAAAQKLIGGNFVIVESREKIFQSLYEPSGFEKLSVETFNKTDDGEDLIVSIRKLA